MNRITREEASFRDPSGYVFYDGTDVFRTVSNSYREDYNWLISSGLKDSLLQSQSLIPFAEVGNIWGLENVFKILQPLKIEPITYPYEWCFSQLKDAALLTLNIQKKALNCGMTLKDASAFNVQFVYNKPVFIDITSFEKYVNGRPWQAYKQFCQHFLCPLFLMTYHSPDFGLLQKNYMDGIPVDFTSELLPARTWLKFSALSHIHWHARTQKQYQDKGSDVSHLKISKEKQILLIDSLISTVKSLSIKKNKTAWSHYYSETNYNEDAMHHKNKLVSEFSEKLKLHNVIDFGANNGAFSRIFSQKKIMTIAADIDPYAVEYNYCKARDENDAYLLPLVADICNPSPALGWNNAERKPLKERLHGDLVLALALIHHLFITHNLSFEQIASFFSAHGRYLIAEFVPLTDSQAQRLIQNRSESFENYNKMQFEEAFQKEFIMLKKEKITGSERILYLFEKRG